MNKFDLIESGISITHPSLLRSDAAHSVIYSPKTFSRMQPLRRYLLSRAKQEFDICICIMVQCLDVLPMPVAYHVLKGYILRRCLMSLSKYRVVIVRLERQTV